MKYTNAKIAVMHDVYGLTDGNAAEAKRIFQERYPNRALPDSRFLRIFIAVLVKLLVSRKVNRKVKLELSELPNLRKLCTRKSTNILRCVHGRLLELIIFVITLFDEIWLVICYIHTAQEFSTACELLLAVPSENYTKSVV